MRYTNTKEYKQHVNRMNSMANSAIRKNVFKTKIKKRKPKIEKPRKVIRSYKVYMKSGLWTKRKNRYFQKYGKFCIICDSKSYVTLHHKEYNNNYGDEPDHELVPFCRRCHSSFHSGYKTKKNMQKETEIFIQEMRQFIKLEEELKEQEIYANY